MYVYYIYLYIISVVFGEKPPVKLQLFLLGKNLQLTSCQLTM